MSELTLYIGDKNLSSWSLRPWIALKQAGIPFTEKIFKLNQPSTNADISTKSPTGLVPCLVADGFTIWDSLAILEYIAETFPEKNLWPSDKRARARARSVSAEMHSGFGDLRKNWPMKFTAVSLRQTPIPEVRKNIDRISTIWTDCRKEFGAGGPFLFGAFSIADAMYAPVVSRVTTYGPVELAPEAEAYRAMMFAAPAMKAWGEDAAREVAESR
jgi:glutathione S-transferase